jgi:hypothetical protein
MDFKRTDGLVCVGLGILICLLSSRIRIGSFHDPGPGFISLLSGLSLNVIGLIMVSVKSFITRPQPANSDKKEAPSHPASSKARFLGMVLLLFAYVFFLERAGYILCTLLVMWGLFYDWGKNRLLRGFLASLVTTAVTYLVFETWLHTQLPRGLFPWW